MSQLFDLTDRHNNNAAVAAEQARFMSKVYLWMSIGLGVTGATGYYVSTSEPLIALFLGNKIVFYGLLILQLVLVLSLSMLAKKVNAFMATALFLTYSLVSGFTFSVFFLAYTLGSMGIVFGITAAMFAGLALFGYTTKIDLAPMGAFLFIALIGLVVAMVVNIFVQNDMFSTIISMIAVLIFAGLTAYDVQKIKAMNIIGNEGTDEDHKETIYGALTLYLDFINMFIHLLNLLGRRR